MPAARQPHQSIAKQLARIQREIDALREMIADHDPQLADRATPAEWIDGMLRAKRRRDAIFAGEGFGDPGWDLLLELYSVDLAKAQIATSELGKAASIAPSTALRWLGQLEQSGLIVRARDDADKRRMFVRLSPKGLALMREYFGQRKRA